LNAIAFLRPWHFRLLVSAVVVGVAGVLIAEARHAGRSSAPFAVLLALAVAVWLLIQFLIWLARQAKAGEAGPIRAIRAAAMPATQDAIGRYLPVLLMAPFFSGFSAIKATVPTFGGWRLDPALAAFDRLLFLGHTPWRVLHDTLGTSVGPVLDATYALWLVVQMSTLFLVAAFGDERLRARFFQSWVLVWLLLGCIGAVILASAGPIFAVEFRLPGNAEFAGLTERLAAAPRALQAREFLLTAYYDGTSQPGSGISAAPSLHVATTMLLVLAARTVHRVLAWLATVFLALILIGSVYLGWHYAADGVIGIIGTTVIWRLTGHFSPSRKHEQAG